MEIIKPDDVLGGEVKSHEWKEEGITRLITQIAPALGQLSHQVGVVAADGLTYGNVRLNFGGNPAGTM